MKNLNHYRTDELAKIMNIQPNSVQGILDDYPQVKRTTTLINGRKRLVFERTSADQYLNERGYLGNKDVTF